MEERPSLKLHLSMADKFIEYLGWMLLIAIWILTLTSYAELPDSIPIHYDFAGEADSFGGKGNIVTMPIVATILFIGMTILNKYPQLFNYPTEISRENAQGLYNNAARMIRYLKVIIVFIFGLNSYQTIRIANGYSSDLGAWFLPLTLALMSIPIVYFMIRSFRIEK